eukprot:4360631-Amphidinium_carterae.1
MALGQNTMIAMTRPERWQRFQSILAMSAPTNHSFPVPQGSGLGAIRVESGYNFCSLCRKHKVRMLNLSSMKRTRSPIPP